MLIFVYEKNRPLLLAKGVHDSGCLFRVFIRYQHYKCFRCVWLWVVTIPEDHVSEYFGCEDQSFHFSVSYNKDFEWIQHYNDVIISPTASQITSLTIAYSTVYAGADQRKHQSSASLAFVRGIHRWPVNSPHKGPVTRKVFPFDDVNMNILWMAHTLTMINLLIGLSCGMQIHQWTWSYLD